MTTRQAITMMDGGAEWLTARDAERSADERRERSYRTSVYGPKPTGPDSGSILSAHPVLSSFLGLTSSESDDAVDRIGAGEDPATVIASIKADRKNINLD
jgi:hypothetical protein